MAGAGDMDEVRRLQAIPMQGRIRLSLTTPLREDDRVIIAFKGGKLMGMGARKRAEHRWGGQPHWVGVLTSLRSECEVLPRRTVIEMYRQLRAQPAGDEPDWELTSILEGNRPARRLLEAGLPGMPRYTRVAGASTFTFTALPVPDRLPKAVGPTAAVPAAPGSATSPGIKVIAPGGSCRVESLHGHRSVVAGYAPAFARIRPVLDPMLRMLGRPGLPKAGTELREAFVVDADWLPGRGPGLAAFVQVIRKAAGSLGADMVHWGLPSDHPDAPWLKRELRAWETRSIVYAVHNADVASPLLRDFRPEVSRL